MVTYTGTFSSYSISNLEQSKSFYQDTLGLEVTQPMGQLELQLAGGAKVFMYSKDDHQAASFTVLNFLVDDIERTMETLRNKGVKFEVYTQEEIKTDEKGLRSADGMKIAWFKDPSANILSLIQNS